MPRSARPHLAILVLALAPYACKSAPSLPPDHSTPHRTTTPSAAILAVDDAIDELAHRGAVVSITPEDLDAGVRAMRVELAGDVAPEQRSFRIVLPPEVPAPLAVGDTVEIRLTRLSGPPTWRPIDVVLTAEDGSLLAAYGVSGPRGWHIDARGEAEREDRGDYDEIAQFVLFTHQGKTAISDSMRWRRLTTADGTWYVAGRALTYEGMLPADAGSSMTYMVVRGR